MGVSLNSIEKHIIKALKQSPNIIIDSRESKLSDYRIARELYRLAKQRRKIHKLLLLNKHNKIQEIYIKGKGLTKPTRV